MKQSHSLNVMNRLAEAYVKLVLAVGEHDGDYVDAYYGPKEWRNDVQASKLPLDAIRKRAVAAQAELKSLRATRMDEMLRLRHQYLVRQMLSLIARVDILGGKKMTFDEESQALYDAAAPTHPEEYFRQFVDELETLLPGKGAIPGRFDKFRMEFVIPKEKLGRVFDAAIQESRKRTKSRIALPDQESFVVEYVTGKSWSGYNWYKGAYHSLIQVNTDFPITIDRAVDLASHEGYPGHHVYNSLLEEHLVHERQWQEFTAYALFSPQSLIAEGTANFGIEMAFPGEERVGFEQKVLFPEAGLDGSRAELYYRIHTIFLKLGYAGNEAARRYLNGEIPREKAAEWLVNYALMSPERAQQRTKFFDQYRSYVINYNLGQDLVRKYIEKRGGTPENPDRRWGEFEKLISSPRLPSGLV